MLVNNLLATIFDGQSSHALAITMAAWMASSRRFTAFVNTHHTKIRKKLRVAQTSENLRDLQLELETAYLLLQEKPLSLEYEPQSKEHGRSPDFAVSFTTSITFMLEVTRLRTALLIPQVDERFTDMLCNKLGQLLPQRGNLLLIGVETPYLVTHDDLHTTMLHLQKRAENNDSTLVQRHGFRDRANFFQHYQRLSGILLRAIPLQAGEPIIIWNNPQTKHPLTAKVRTALSRSHTL
jgi:hypothetical protein